MTDTGFPRENLYRAVMPGVEYRSDGESDAPMLRGHFAVFNTPTEINSPYEGRFIERIAPGAFKKTISEGRDAMRVLFQHGRDPQIGDKPLGEIVDLREDETGAAYEVRMLDTSYNADLLPGLKAGLYGASFRFRVVREDINRSPEASAANPDAIPERTIQEAQVLEFGPVTWGQYPEATAGVRCLTDVLRDVDAVTLATPILLDEERLAQAQQFLTRSNPAESPSEEPEEAEEPSEASENRSSAPIRAPKRPRAPLYGMREAQPDWRL